MCIKRIGSCHIVTKVQHLRCLPSDASYLRLFPSLSIPGVSKCQRTCFSTDFIPWSKSRQLSPSRTNHTLFEILKFTAFSCLWILRFILFPVAATAATGSCFLTSASISYLEKTPFQRDSSINYLVFEQETKAFKTRKKGFWKGLLGHMNKFGFVH